MTDAADVATPRPRKTSETWGTRGEAHAQVYISRWFESLCAPPKAVFKAS